MSRIWHHELAYPIILTSQARSKHLAHLLRITGHPGTLRIICMCHAYQLYPSLHECIPFPSYPPLSRQALSRLYNRLSLGANGMQHGALRPAGGGGQLADSEAGGGGGATSRRETSRSSGGQAGDGQWEEGGWTVGKASGKASREGE